MRLGIMGGTFDPIHNGHLFIAEEARVRLTLDHVLFVPNGAPPHKLRVDITPANQRFCMTELATAPNKHFSCSRLEMNSETPSYAVNTLRAITKEYSGAQLYYITGIDAVADILTWRNHQEVVELSTFVAATRPGYDQEMLQARLPKSYLERITILESVALEISSTNIRHRIQEGLPVRYLLPDPVLEYIVCNDLYRVASQSTTP